MFSVSEDVSVPAVTVRPSAETMPDVTVGVPAASPSALPMATTESPASSLLELPNVTVGRFDAIFDVSVKLHHRTDGSILVSDDGDERKAVWLPLSQIEINSEKNGVLEITAPTWLLKDKGLI